MSSRPLPEPPPDEAEARWQAYLRRQESDETEGDGEDADAPPALSLPPPDFAPPSPPQEEESDEERLASAVSDNNSALQKLKGRRSRIQQVRARLAEDAPPTAGSDLNRKLDLVEAEIQARSAFASDPSADAEATLRIRLLTIQRQYPEERFSGDIADPTVLECRVRLEQAIRNELRKTMVEVINAGRFTYPLTQKHLYHLPAPWRPNEVVEGKPQGSFKMSYFAGAPVSVAIRALRGQAPAVIECMAAIQICYYIALLNILGDQGIDAKFPNGIFLAQFSEAEGLWKEEWIEPEEIRPGDRVYFYNHPDYGARHANSSRPYLQGENGMLIDTIDHSNISRYGAGRFWGERRPAMESIIGQPYFEGFGMGGTQEKIEGDLDRAYRATPEKWDGTAGRFVEDEARNREYPASTDRVPGLRSPAQLSGGKINPNHGKVFVFRPKIEAFTV